MGFIKMTLNAQHFMEDIGMNETLKKALDEFKALGKCINANKKEWLAWADAYGIDLSSYDNVKQVQVFFDTLCHILNDDKYITDKLFVRYCPDSLTADSAYVKLFDAFHIDEVVITIEAKTCLIAALMANGFKAEPIKLRLTDAWGKDNYFAEKNIVQYGNAILLKR